MINATSDTGEIESTIRSLLHQKLPPEDRSGRSPLVALAELLAKTAPDDDAKTKYAWASAQLIKEVEQFSEDAVRRLVRFLYAARFSSGPILDEVKRLLRSGCRAKGDIRKRAELLRWSITRGERMLPNELNKEVEIKSRHPWLWIDAMAASDWEVAKKEIIAALRKQKTARDLLVRLPYYWKKHPLTNDDFGPWLAALPKPEGDKLRNWSERREMSNLKSSAVPEIANEEGSTAPGIDPEGIKFVRTAILEENCELHL